MKNYLIIVLVASLCVFSAKDALSQGRSKSFSIDMSKIKVGTNLIYADSEVKIYAKHEKGKPTVYSAKKADGTNMNISFQSDVVATGMSASSTSARPSGGVGAGAGIPTTTNGGRTIDGGNTPKGGTTAPDPLKKVNCTFIPTGMVCK